MATIAEMLIFLAGLTLIGFCSGAATVLTGIRRARLWHLLTTDREAGLELEAKLAQYRSSIVLVRMVAVTATTAVSILLALDLADGAWWSVLVACLAIMAVIVYIESRVRLVVAEESERYFNALAVPLAIIGTLTRRLTRLIPLSSEAVYSYSAESADGTNRPSDTVREIQEIVSTPAQSQVLDKADQDMIGAVMGLKETPVREVMTLRPDIVAVSTEETLDAVIAIILGKGHMRVPVYHETLDSVVGIIHYSDVLRALQQGGELPPLRSLAKAPYFVPEFKKARDLLREFLVKDVHMAVVVDEYGGVEGVVTMTDLVKEIVGDIAPDKEVSFVKDGEAIFDGQVSIDEVNETLGTRVAPDGYETIGGFVLHKLGRLAKPGDAINAEGIHVDVLSIAGRRIRKLRVRRLEPAGELPSSQSAS